jgi:hypothetical protein
MSARRLRVAVIAFRISLAPSLRTTSPVVQSGAPDVQQQKSISALQIQRHMGFGSYETAHSMCHKIRAALIEPETKLGGIVEV